MCFITIQPNNLVPAISQLFIPQSDMVNMTGLFYIGIGVEADSSTFDNLTVTYQDKPIGVTGKWVFVRGLYIYLLVVSC